MPRAGSRLRGVEGVGHDGKVGTAHFCEWYRARVFRRLPEAALLDDTAWQQAGDFDSDELQSWETSDLAE